LFLVPTLTQVAETVVKQWIGTLALNTHILSAPVRAALIIIISNMLMLVQQNIFAHLEEKRRKP
jgi:hypothetical protein